MVWNTELSRLFLLLNGMSLFFICLYCFLLISDIHICRIASLPSLSESKLGNIVIKNPITQHVNASNGAFRLQNIEKQKKFNIAEWRLMTERSENQPPAKRGERRTVNKENNKRKNCPCLSDIEFDSNSFTTQRCFELERIYWKTLTYNSPMYGADMPGSLFDDSTKIWNVSKLNDMLSSLPIKIPGVNSSYLYCGMWKSTFAWHLEDMDLYSINYLHFGAPKMWYSISQKDRHKFYEVMKDIWPEEYISCKEFLRHKTFHASPSLLMSHGIKVNKLIHHENEFVLTFPYGYHAGFNFGYNCAESVNFAIPEWLPIGKLAKQCMCISDSVGIDVVGLFINDQKSDTVDLNPILSSVKGSIVPKKRKRPLSFNFQSGVKEDHLLESDSNVDLKWKTKRPHPHKNNSIGDFKITTKHPCLLCPSHQHLPMVFVQDGRAVHRICALYIPETYSEITSKGRELVYGVEKIPETRWMLKCAYCDTTEGACIQCSSGPCTRSYHPSCAQSAGIVVSIEDNKHGPKIRFLCNSHQPKVISSRTKIKNIYNGFTLLPGDLVQFQMPSGKVHSGIVRKNNISEQSAFLSLQHNIKLIEISWERIFVPGIITNKNNNLMQQPKLQIQSLKASENAFKTVDETTKVVSTEVAQIGTSSKDSGRFEHFQTGKYFHCFELEIPQVDLDSRMRFYDPISSSDTKARYN